MPTELDLVQQMARSKYWKWMRTYLLERRENLLRETVGTTEHLWRNRGAIEEVTRLLQAPELVSKVLASQRPDPKLTEGADIPEWLQPRPVEDYDG